MQYLLTEEEYKNIKSEIDLKVNEGLNKIRKDIVQVMKDVRVDDSMLYRNHELDCFIKKLRVVIKC